MRQLLNKPAKGFTIIELLIASSVFTVVLILITTGVLQFSRQYYKGIISTRTQETARAVIDDVARTIQLNTGTVTPLLVSGPARGFCIGEVKRYNYILGQKITDTGSLSSRQTRHALVADNTSNCNATTNAINYRTTTNLPSSSNARELLGQNMRLTKFSITGSQDVYTITVRVVYGDDDLLCSEGLASSCAPTAAFPTGRDDLKCKSSKGAQFCAMSELTTTVQKRVN